MKTIEEKIKEASSIYSGIYRDMYITGIKSEVAAEYHKEKNKWYSEEEVINILRKLSVDTYYNQVQGNGDLFSVVGLNRWIERSLK